MANNLINKICEIVHKQLLIQKNHEIKFRNKLRSKNR